LPVGSNQNAASRALSASVAKNAAILAQLRMLMPTFILEQIASPAAPVVIFARRTQYPSPNRQCQQTQAVAISWLPAAPD
jgi:hypothetical protein